MNRKFIFSMLSTILLLSLIGCSNPTSVKDNNVDYSKSVGFSIKLPGTKKTSKAVYTLEEVEKFVVDVSLGFDRVASKEAEPGDTISFSFQEEGTYKIFITAYNSENKVIASGTKTQELRFGMGTVPISIVVNPKQKSIDVEIEVIWGNGEETASTLTSKTTHMEAIPVEDGIRIIVTNYDAEPTFNFATISSVGQEICYVLTDHEPTKVGNKTVYDFIYPFMDKDGEGNSIEQVFELHYETAQEAEFNEYVVCKSDAEGLPIINLPEEWETADITVDDSTANDRFLIVHGNQEKLESYLHNPIINEESIRTSAELAYGSYGVWGKNHRWLTGASWKFDDEKTDRIFTTGLNIMNSDDGWWMTPGAIDAALSIEGKFWGVFFHTFKLTEELCAKYKLTGAWKSVDVISSKSVLTYKPIENHIIATPDADGNGLSLQIYDLGYTYNYGSSYRKNLIFEIAPSDDLDKVASFELNSYRDVIENGVITTYSITYPITISYPFTVTGKEYQISLYYVDEGPYQSQPTKVETVKCIANGGCGEFDSNILSDNYIGELYHKTGADMNYVDPYDYLVCDLKLKDAENIVPYILNNDYISSSYGYFVISAPYLPDYNNKTTYSTNLGSNADICERSMSFSSRDYFISSLISGRECYVDFYVKYEMKDKSKYPFILRTNPVSGSLIW